jgi:hypothetical protein
LIFRSADLGAFTGTVAMTCTNLPLYAACNFTPASSAVSSTPTQVALRINTTQKAQASVAPLAGFSGVFGLLALMFPVMNFRTHHRLSKKWLVLCLLAICAGMLLLNGCGGGGTSNNNQLPTSLTTPSGTYTITVVATSATLSHSTNVTVVVQ